MFINLLYNNLLYFATLNNLKSIVINIYIYIINYYLLFIIYNFNLFIISTNSL